MNMPKNMKNFEDPLYAGLSNRKPEKIQDNTSEEAPAGKHNNHTLLLAVLLVGTVSVLAYFLYQAQTNIDHLAAELTANKDDLAVVSQNLDESNAQISELNQGLDASKQKLTSQGRELNRYKDLYAEVKTDQEQQTRELQAIDLRKAEQDEVDELKQQASELKGETSQIKEKLTEANSNIATLDQKTTENKGQIDQNRAAVTEVRTATESNSAEIAGVKKSLEREYFNFELHEKGGYMKVFEVSLSLKDTDFKKRQYDLYVLADGKVIQKKDQSINEPIHFYVDGKKKPYEVVVTRVDKKLVVGYLSVPKT
jgi:hypothetical protein